jgi:hypothetical protein
MTAIWADATSTLGEELGLPVPDAFGRAAYKAGIMATVVERDALRLEAGAQHQPRTLTDLKVPSEKDWMVYRLVRIGGMKQVDAERVMTENRQPYRQGQISKGLDKCDAWIGAGGIMPPELAVSLKRTRRNPVSVDPDDIELGERTDGRTPAQREHRSE